VSFEIVVFYLFSAIVVFSAFRVITVNNPVFAAMFLVLTFFTCAAIWMLLEAEFLAITLVLVYVGAVMVLFLFVVMMLDVNVVASKEGFVKYLPVGLLVGAIMLVEMPRPSISGLPNRLISTRLIVCALCPCRLQLLLVRLHPGLLVRKEISRDFAVALPDACSDPVLLECRWNFFKSQKRDHSVDVD